MKFRKEKFQVLYLGRNNLMHQHRLGGTGRKELCGEGPPDPGGQETEHESATYP